MQEKWVQSLGQEGPLEKEMAIHSCILTWKIPWEGEPGGLQSIGSQKSQPLLSDWTYTHARTSWELYQHSNSYPGHGFQTLKCTKITSRILKKKKKNIFGYYPKSSWFSKSGMYLEFQFPISRQVRLNLAASGLHSEIPSPAIGSFKAPQVIFLFKEGWELQI